MTQKVPHEIDKSVAYQYKRMAYMKTPRRHHQYQQQQKQQQQQQHQKQQQQQLQQQKQQNHNPHQKQKNIGEKKKMKSHPDGGWGWCVVMAAFSVQFIILGLQNSSGVIFNQLVKKFDRGRGETGFVSSISCGIMFILGPFTTSLCERFTCRLIAILGGVLCTVGMVTSAYAPSLKIMYLSFGVTWGLGTSFCYFPTLIILVPYFNKRLALVNGIVASGSGVGTLVLSPFIQWFAQRFGVESMFFMLGGLHGLVFLAGFVYRPIEQKYEVIQNKTNEGTDYEANVDIPKDHQVIRRLDAKNADRTKKDEMKKEKDMMQQRPGNQRRNNGKLFDNVAFVSLISDKAFMSWSLGLSVFILGYFVPFVHLVRYAKLRGVPEVNAAFLISILSITATICKVISGKVAGLKQINKIRMYQCALLIMTVATTLVPLARSYTGFVIYAVVFGVSESCFLVMIPLITKEIIGIRRLPLALGVTFMSMGFTTVLGAPIAGWIYDAFGQYSYAFYLAGGLNATGVLIMFAINVFNDNKSHQLETTVLIEDKTERPTSRVMEFTCFASSERIYYSELSIPQALSTMKSLNDVDRTQSLRASINSFTKANSLPRGISRPKSCVVGGREKPPDYRRSLWMKNNSIVLEKSMSCMQLEHKEKTRDLLLPVHTIREEDFQLSSPITISEASFESARVTSL